MGQLTFTRREALIAGAGTALAGGALSASAAAPALDLEDPAVRARVRAKVSGSAGEEKVYKFYRLHIYAYMHDGNLQPLYTMNNLNVTLCRPLEDNYYAFKVFEAGVYCKFDTDEVLESWENPITGEVREPWTFIGGPLNVKLGPDGVETPPEATVHPTALRMEAYGGMVFVPVASHFSYPSPFDPEEWPKESAGPVNYLGFPVCPRRQGGRRGQSGHRQRAGLLPVPEPGELGPVGRHGWHCGSKLRPGLRYQAVRPR